MTEEEFNDLPCLTACPGKPACDKDSLCGDHRDVFRWMQRKEAAWRDTIIKAREARDGADLQVAAMRKTLSAIAAIATKEFADEHNDFGDVGESLQDIADLATGTEKPVDLPPEIPFTDEEMRLLRESPHKTPVGEKRICGCLNKTFLNGVCGSCGGIAL